MISENHLNYSSMRTIDMIDAQHCIDIDVVKSNEQISSSAATSVICMNGRR